VQVLPLEPGRPPDFELSIGIDVPSETLRAFLLDLRGYVALHPFIESIEDLPPDEALPAASFHRVVDRIPVGPFRLKTVYVAALEPVSDAEVHGHAWQSPGVRLRTIYRLAETPAGTRLTERCHVDAPALLRRFVVRQAKRAHAETLAGMKRLLEQGAGSGPPVAAAER
jgi:hypothetical protein